MFWRGFNVLSVTRSWSDGYPNRIQYCPISDYARNHCIDDIEFFEEIVTMLDYEWTKFMSDKIKAMEKSKNRKR